MTSTCSSWPIICMNCSTLSCSIDIVQTSQSMCCTTWWPGLWSFSPTLWICCPWGALWCSCMMWPTCLSRSSSWPSMSLTSMCRASVMDWCWCPGSTSAYGSSPGISSTVSMLSATVVNTRALTWISQCLTCFLRSLAVYCACTSSGSTSWSRDSSAGAAARASLITWASVAQSTETLTQLTLQIAREIENKTRCINSEGKQLLRKVRGSRDLYALSMKTYFWRYGLGRVSNGCWMPSTFSTEVNR